MKTLLYSKDLKTKWFAALVGMFMAGQVAAQIVSWNPSGLADFGPSPWAATSSDANITVGGLTRGAGISISTTTPAGNAWGGANWAGAADQDATFTITANTGYTVSLTTFNLFYRRSGTGPAAGTLEYALDAGAYTNIAPLTFSSSASSGAAHAPVDLSGISALQNVPAGTVIHFRIFPTGGVSTGNWYVYGSGLSINGSVDAVTTVCTTPTGLGVSGVTTTNADFEWDAETGIDGFEYVLDMSAADPAGAGTFTSANTYSDNTLTPATTYYFHLRKDCGSGNYSDWETIDFTTDAVVVPCADPTGLGVSGVTHNTAVIDWDASAGVTFEYVLDNTATDPAGAGTATAANTYDAAGALTPATTYYFHLRSDCGGGDYSDWVTIDFTTDVTTGINETAMEAITLYPNPVQNILNFVSAEKGVLTLSDMTGKVLLQTNVNSTLTNIDLSAYSNQVYVLSFSNESLSRTFKVVKQ